MRKHSHIMAVDDDKEVLRILKRTLELEGYDVAVAPDGGSALELLEEWQPDLVILDIKMPGLDGFQTLERIRQRSSIPVIMLTAKRDATTLNEALALGADDFVKKPFATGELVARIKAKLRRAG